MKMTIKDQEPLHKPVRETVLSEEFMIPTFPEVVFKRVNVNPNPNINFGYKHGWYLVYALNTGTLMQVEENTVVMPVITELIVTKK